MPLLSINIDQLREESYSTFKSFNRSHMDLLCVYSGTIVAGFISLLYENCKSYGESSRGIVVERLYGSRKRYEKSNRLCLGYL